MLSILLSWKFWAFLAAGTTALSALIVLKPWVPIVVGFRRYLAERDRRRLLRYMGREERNFDKALQSPEMFGVPTAPARMQGHMLVSSPAAEVLEKMHNVSRRTFELPPIALLSDGVLDRAKIEASFVEIHRKLDEFATYEFRYDVATIAAWCIVITLALTMISLYLA